jgi:hypothetical protein
MPDATAKPVIRIASVQQPPERVVIDTTQPTIIPPPTMVVKEDAIASKPPLQSYASVAPISTLADVDQKKRKASKRQIPKLAPNRPQFASHPVPASRSPATTVAPVRLSFIDYISSQLRRNLFNLNWAFALLGGSGAGFHSPQRARRLRHASQKTAWMVDPQMPCTLFILAILSPRNIFDTAKRRIQRIAKIRWRKWREVKRNAVGTDWYFHGPEQCPEPLYWHFLSIHLGDPAGIINVM